MRASASVACSGSDSSCAASPPFSICARINRQTPHRHNTTMAMMMKCIRASLAVRKDFIDDDPAHILQAPQVKIKYPPARATLSQINIDDKRRDGQPYAHRNEHGVVVNHVRQNAQAHARNQRHQFLLLLSKHEIRHAQNSCEHIHNQVGRIKAHRFLEARPSVVRLCTPALLRIML